MKTICDHLSDIASTEKLDWDMDKGIGKKILLHSRNNMTK